MQRGSGLENGRAFESSPEGGIRPSWKEKSFIVFQRRRKWQASIADKGFSFKEGTSFGELGQRTHVVHVERDGPKVVHVEHDKGPPSTTGPGPGNVPPSRVSLLVTELGRGGPILIHRSTYSSLGSFVGHLTDPSLGRNRIFDDSKGSGTGVCRQAILPMERSTDSDEAILATNKWRFPLLSASRKRYWRSKLAIRRHLRGFVETVDEYPNSMVANSIEFAEKGFGSRNPLPGEGENLTQMADSRCLLTLDGSSDPKVVEPGRDLMEANTEEAEQMIAAGKMLGVSFEGHEALLVQQILEMEQEEDGGLANAGEGLVKERTDGDNHASR